MRLTALHPAPPELIPALIAAMSSADRTELIALSQGATTATIQLALDRSSYSFCWTLAGQPAAIGGVVAGDPNFIWMIASTPRLEHSKKSFLQLSRAELRQVLALYPHIVSAVDNRWRKSIRWLKWLGFRDTGKEVKLGGRGAAVLEIGP